MDPSHGDSHNSLLFGGPFDFSALISPPLDSGVSSPLDCWPFSSTLDAPLFHPAAPDSGGDVGISSALDSSPSYSGVSPSLDYLLSSPTLDSPFNPPALDSGGDGQPRVIPELSDTDEDEDDGTFIEKGKEVCLLDDFLTSMFGAQEEWLELPRKSDEFRVFCYSQQNESLSNFRPLSSQSSYGIASSAATGPGPSRSPQPQSIQDKIKSLFRSIKLRRGGVLVQFWAAGETNSSQITLSVLGQPFGVTELYNGLCRYREDCIQLCSSSENIKSLGPPGRVFTRQTSEFCSDIILYSLKDFPLKNCAKKWGIQGYTAMPLFERDGPPQRCIGVLEFVSFIERIPWNRSSSMKNKDFVCTRSHCKACKQFHQELVMRQCHLLDYIRVKCIGDIEHEVWVPCICDVPGSSAASHKNHHIQLFQGPNFYWEPNYKSKSFSFDSQAYFVQNGKSWVGRAYSQNKVCFFRDRSRCSFSDYPYVYFTRVPLCFAIPLKLVHPKLPSLVLEVFLLPKDNDEDDTYEDPKSLLKSLLSKLIQQLSIYDVTFKLQPNMEFWVEFSHCDEENYEYFNVSARAGTMNDSEILAVGRARNIYSLHQPPTLEVNVQHSQIDNLLGREECTQIDNLVGRQEHFPFIHNANSQDRCKVSVNACAQITVDGADNGQFQVDTENFGGDQHQNPEYFCSELQSALLDQQPTAGRTVRESALVGGETDHQPLSIADYVNAFTATDIIRQVAGGNFGAEACNANGHIAVTLDAMEIEPSQIGLANIGGGQTEGNLTEKQHFTSPNPTTEQICPEMVYKTRDGRQITFDEVKVHFDKSREDTIKALGVTKKVFKNIRERFHILDWRGMKKLHSFGSVEAIKEIKKMYDESMKAEAVAKEKSVATEGDSNNDGSYNMNVMGTYGEKNVFFEFRSDKGLKKLSKEFADRFGLKVESVVIKYQRKQEGDDKWITISGNKDLQFHIKGLQSLRQKEMELSIDGTTK